MRLFSLLYIAASHTVHYFSCVVLVVTHTHTYIYIIFDIFSINVETVGEFCKAQ